MATRKRAPGVKSTSGTAGGAKSRPSAKRAAKGKATKKAAARRGKAVVEYFEGPATAGGSSLVIVESPTKAKTIGQYLGEGYEVLSSVGHIRDLIEPKNLAAELENPAGETK